MAQAANRSRQTSPAVPAPQPGFYQSEGRQRRALARVFPSWLEGREEGRCPSRRAEEVG